MTVHVKIDDVVTTLTFERYSPDRGFQYTTPGFWSSHGFQTKLETTYKPGEAFHTNGHRYEILNADGSSASGDREALLSAAHAVKHTPERDAAQQQLERARMTEGLLTSISRVRRYRVYYVRVDGTINPPTGESVVLADSVDAARSYFSELYPSFEIGSIVLEEVP